MLAHAPKPNQQGTSPSAITAALPTLEPLAPLSGFNPDGNFFQNQQSFNPQPRARTRSFFSTGGS